MSKLDLTFKNRGETGAIPISKANLNALVNAINDNADNIKFTSNLQENDNLDNFKTEGIYYCDGGNKARTIAHMPYTSYSSIVVVHRPSHSSSSTAIIMQACIATNGSEVYIRRCYNSVWEDWHGYGNPIGSVVITGTSTNPSSRLGGTWTLVDKDFSHTLNSETDSGNYFVPDTTKVKTYTMSFVRTRDNLKINLAITPKVAIADNDDTVLGSINKTGLGLNNDTYPFAYISRIVGYSDEANALVGVEIGATGSVSVRDIITRGSSSDSIPANNKIYISFDVNVYHTHKADSACDKFYWKKTA